MILLKELVNIQIKNITFKFNNIEDFKKLKNLPSKNGETEIKIHLSKNNKFINFD